MRVSHYFIQTRQRADRRNIQLEWITRVKEHPIREETQSDGRIRLWGTIPEADDRYLRVVLLEDRETVHNAFFDRSFREES